MICTIAPTQLLITVGLALTALACGILGLSSDEAEFAVDAANNLIINAPLGFDVLISNTSVSTLVSQVTALQARNASLTTSYATLSSFTSTQTSSLTAQYNALAAYTSTLTDLATQLLKAQNSVPTCFVRASPYSIASLRCRPNRL